MPSKAKWIYRYFPPGKPAPYARRSLMALSAWVTVAAIGAAAYALVHAPGNAFLMPGPLTTAHSSNAKCSSCHKNLAGGKLGWLGALVTHADPAKDSKACSTCHEMGNNSLSSHGLDPANLRKIARRQKTAGVVTALSVTDRLEQFLHPKNEAGDKSLFCATCHKEHRGKHDNLVSLSNGQCDTCHKVKSDSFQNRHPEFKDYPFRRRTRIIFDHGAHFKDHFPKTRKKSPDLKKIPNSCASCHSSENNARHMSTKPFAQTCSTCHLPQITGTARAVGPKGIALLSLPGIDLQTLKEKKLDIGEWPSDSDAEISPFMKLLLGRDERERQVLAVVSKLDLLDLAQATDQDLSAVVAFVWQVKRLINGLTTSKASEVMQRLSARSSAKLSRQLMARLIATMPRDVLLSAQREWLPNLAREMKSHGNPGWVALVSSARKPTKVPKADTLGTPAARPDDKAADPANPPDRLVTNAKYGRWRINVLGELVQEGSPSETGGPSAPDSEDGAQDDTPAATGTTDNDLKKAAKNPVALDEQARTAVDAEAWTEFGGWYRKDFAVLYRPTGHGDEFLKSWLDFSGKLLEQTDASLAAPVFNLLSGKDAQGKCTKCHSIDGNARGSVTLQWHPSSPDVKKTGFTKFAHEPHFRLLDDRGCLTCHEMSTLKKKKISYKTLNPTGAISDFNAIRKSQCTTCHKKNTARQDCLACHKYHVTPIRMPITSTRLPGK